MANRKIITGIKPTGSIHLGNYFGTIRQIVDLQDSGEMFVFLADLHALTGCSDADSRHDSNLFEKYSHDVIRAYVALGVDPKKTVIYRQSEFPQITELTWIFSCLLKHQFLTIGHAYKDALQQEKEPGLGVFLYPVLMAADILLLGANTVPVGKDQVQHVEMAREIARKFNMLTETRYFSEPQEQVVKETAVVPGIDGRKMSKSYDNVLPIFADETEIRKRIMGITTDSTPAGQPIRPDNCTICSYLELLLSREKYGDVANKCLHGKISYKELKEMLVDAYLDYFKDARETYAKLENNSSYIDRLLGQHRKKMDTLFTDRLNEVRRMLGLGIPHKQKWFR